MLFNVSYSNPEITESIDALVGEPYPLLKRWGKGVTGSQRFVLKDANEELLATVRPAFKITFCNIGMRPKGITIWFSVKLHTYLLALPYRNLIIAVENDCLHLRSGPWWLLLVPAHNASLNMKFIKQLEKHRKKSLP